MDGNKNIKTSDKPTEGKINVLNKSRGKAEDEHDRNCTGEGIPIIA